MHSVEVIIIIISGCFFTFTEIISIKDADPRDNNNELYEVSCNNQETSLGGCSITPCVDNTDIGQPFIYCLGMCVCICVSIVKIR